MSLTELPYVPVTEDDEERAERRKPHEKFVRMVHAFSGKGRAKSLERDEERALIAKWKKAACAKSLEKLLYAYDGFLQSSVLQFCNKVGVPYDHREDFKTEATLAFIHAVGKYDPTNDARISAFARYHVVAAMVRCHNETQRPVRVGTSLGEKRALAGRKALRAQFEEAFGRPLRESDDTDLKALSDLTGLSFRGLKRGFAAHRLRTVSPDEVHIADPNADVRPDTERLLNAIRQGMDRISAILSVRDYAIVRTAFEDELAGRDPRLKELAERNQLTIERIRQVYRLGKSLMREHFEGQDVRRYSDLA